MRRSLSAAASCLAISSAASSSSSFSSIFYSTLSAFILSITWVRRFSASKVLSSLSELKYLSTSSVNSWKYYLQGYSDILLKLTLHNYNKYTVAFYSCGNLIATYENTCEKLYLIFSMGHNNSPYRIKSSDEAIPLFSRNESKRRGS